MVHVQMSYKHYACIFFAHNVLLFLANPGRCIFQLVSRAAGVDPGIIFLVLPSDVTGGRHGRRALGPALRRPRVLLRQCRIDSPQPIGSESEPYSISGYKVLFRLCWGKLTLNNVIDY